MTSLLGISLFVLALMIAIFLHEGGHFTTAKLFGMKVERFFLGFGPTNWVFPRGGARGGGNLRGGHRPAGAAAPPAPGERQFRKKPAWQRSIVLAAGSITHFLVAILLIWMVLVAIGIGTGQATTTIDRTVTLNAGTPSPAQNAGLRAGDQITAVDGNQVPTFEELRNALSRTGGKQITIDYIRDGERRSTTARPVEQDGRGFLGFQPSEETRGAGVPAAFPQSVKLFWDTTVATVKGLGGFVTGLADRISAPGPAPA